MAKTYQRTKLQEVTIRGYKSIAYDRPVTLKLGDVSILLGANGAGKSNIISFFRMLSYMMSKSFGDMWKYRARLMPCCITALNGHRSCPEN